MTCLNVLCGLSSDASDDSCDELTDCETGVGGVGVGGGAMGIICDEAEDRLVVFGRSGGSEKYPIGGVTRTVGG